jgi:NADP-dependent 3-hydroxy acid dehydrogenase YdfG
MSTIAIIGAGPGVGRAVARRFGREGFAVALISRSQDKVDALASELTADGVTARGYAADVLDAEALTAALTAAAADLGPVSVLQYSPLPARHYLRPVTETPAADILEAVRFSVLGPVAAVEAVLPGMSDAGAGTLVFINGGTSVRPRAEYAGTSIGFAGESAYVQMLHDALTPAGIRVAQLVIPGAIRGEDPEHGHDAVAERIWGLHTTPGEFREFLSPLD